MVAISVRRKVIMPVSVNSSRINPLKIGRKSALKNDFVPVAYSQVTNSQSVERRKPVGLTDVQLVIIRCSIHSYKETEVLNQGNQLVSQLWNTTTN